MLRGAGEEDSSVGASGWTSRGRRDGAGGEGGIRAETGVLGKAEAKDEEPGERKQGKEDLQAILVLGNVNMLQ